MQSLLECPVCTYVYDNRQRLPKTLACGHVLCSQCIWSLLNGSEVKCPKCRNSTNVPVLNFENLPTSYATLEYMEQACGVCKYQAWSLRCEHCATNVCESCHRQHRGLDDSDEAEGNQQHGSDPTNKDSDSRVDLTAITDQISRLQDSLDDDSELSFISNQGDQIVQQVREHYQGYIARLTRRQEEVTQRVRSMVEEDVTRFMTWREDSARDLLEARILVDRCKVLQNLAPLSRDTARELESACRDQAFTLSGAFQRRPNAAKLYFEAAGDDKLETLAQDVGTLVITTTSDGDESVGISPTTSHAAFFETLSDALLDDKPPQDNRVDKDTQTGFSDDLSKSSVDGISSEFDL